MPQNRLECERLGNILRDLRIDAMLSQVELADVLWLRNTAISNWEIGRHPYSADRVIEICQKLKCTPNQLFGWEDAPVYYPEDVCGLKSLTSDYKS